MKFSEKWVALLVSNELLSKIPKQKTFSNTEQLRKFQLG